MTNAKYEVSISYGSKVKVNVFVKSHGQGH